MEYFSVLKDSDIFENQTIEPDVYEPRLTVKGIVLDVDNKIAILSNGEHSLFPGGGVEEGETLEAGFTRECKEEIGCDVEIISKIGEALQFRAKNKKKYDIHFFVAKVIGEKGRPTTTQEGELSCILSWSNNEEILKILENQISQIREDDYPAHFNCRTQLAAFKTFLKLIN